MNAFHVIGSLAAIWAISLGLMGITREDFPGGLEKVVGAISVLLVVSAITAAILTSGHEKDEHGGGAKEATQSESQ